MLLLTSCTVKYYTPRIPESYQCDIAVSLGDFDYKCRFCKTASTATVTVSDTNAEGLEMVCDGEELVMNYGEWAETYSAYDFEQSNPAIVLWQVFDALESGNVQSGKTETGYKYEGRIPLGEFILTQNDDETLNALTVKNTDFTILFN